VPPRLTGPLSAFFIMIAEAVLEGEGAQFAITPQGVVREQSRRGAKARKPCSSKIRTQMVNLIRVDRVLGKLTRESEPTAQPIRTWVNNAGRDEGVGADSVMTSRRDETRGRCQENWQLKTEREVSEKAPVWFVWETDLLPPNPSNL